MTNPIPGPWRTPILIGCADGGYRPPLRVLVLGIPCCDAGIGHRGVELGEEPAGLGQLLIFIFTDGLGDGVPMPGRLHGARSATPEARDGHTLHHGWIGAGSIGGAA